MAKSKPAKKAKETVHKKATDTLPDNFESMEAFDEFWDSQSLADHEEHLEDVDVEMDIKTIKTYFPLAKDLIFPLRNYAESQGVSVETLINLWLVEKLKDANAKVTR